MSSSSAVEYPDSPDEVHGQEDDKDDLFPDGEVADVDENPSLDDNDTFDESLLEDEEL